MIAQRQLVVLGEHPQVHHASEAIINQVAKQRWHQALRKRTNEVRLASAIWTATTISDRWGLPNHGDLAERVVRADAGEDERWRVLRPLRTCLTYLGELGGAPDTSAPGTIMMALLRDSELDVADLLPLRRCANLLEMTGPGLVRTALAMALIGHVGDQQPDLVRARADALMCAVGKVISVHSGLEATGIAVFDDPQHREVRRAAMAGSASATTQWCVLVGEMILAGLHASEAVCRQVVAGSR